MQQTLAISGTEWGAADMSFDQQAKADAIRSRTQMWAGTSCVWFGGAVTNPSGLTLVIAGPLKFQALGEMAVIVSPANLTATPSATSYVVGQYLETTDTPAPFYAGGSPPNIHQNAAPTVIVRATPAVEANHEVNLATVVAGVATVTSITDTRIIGPTVTAGNIALGAGNTVDGMDPSVHQALAATSAVLGHVILGPGGAAAYGTLGGDYSQDFFLDLLSGLATNHVLDDADFSVPPTGATAVRTVNHPTRYGDLWYAGYGPRVCSRFTLQFLSTVNLTVPLYVACWDTTLRIRANGTQIFSAAAAGTDQALSFNVTVGGNTLKFYHGNVDGNQFYLQIYCPLLSTTGMTFNG